MAYFEFVQRVQENKDLLHGDEDIEVVLPKRATENSAGYDFMVLEETTVPSIWCEMAAIGEPRSIEEIALWTKNHCRPTLAPTGVKCKLDSNQYLELAIRSSIPLKTWTILANGVGVIDADYYGNEDNDGEIFFQLINLSPFQLTLKKGDVIGQGIIKTFETVDDDAAEGKRAGGFGSTTVVKEMDEQDLAIYDN